MHFISIFIPILMKILYQYYSFILYWFITSMIHILYFIIIFYANDLFGLLKENV